MPPLRRSPFIFVLVWFPACSFQDYGYLKSGSAGDSGDGGSAGEPQTTGGSGGNSSTKTTQKGGSSGKGGSSNKGGSSSTGGTAAGGTTATGGGPSNPYVAYGPWTFDSEADVPLNWIRARGGVAVSWTGEGETAPKGSLVLDSTGASTNAGDVRHNFDPPTDLTQQTITARVRMSSGESTFQFYGTTATSFGLGYGPAILVNTEWTTVSWAFNNPVTTSGVYNPAQTLFIAAQINTKGILWIDSVTLTPPL